MSRINHPNYDNPARFARSAFLKGFIAMYEMTRVMTHAENYFAEDSWETTEHD